MRTLLAIVAVLVLSGCTSLIIRDYDSGLETTGKVAARAVLGLATVGISEAGIAGLKRDEARHAEIMNGHAACKAQGMVYAYREFPFQSIGCMTQQGYEALVKADAENRPRIDPLAAYFLLQGMQRSARQPATCSSWIMGNHVTTDCY